MASLQNVSAFALPLLLLLYWSILGYPVLSWLCKGRNSVQNALLSPVFGFSLLVLPIFYLNRIGLPVREFSTILTIVGCIPIIVGLATKSILLPWRRLMPYGIILLCCHSFIAHPLLEFGYAWLGLFNFDHVTLSSAAQYLTSHGFYDGFDLAALKEGKDYSQYSVFLYVVGGHRVGAEYLLAWLGSLTGLLPDRIYQSMIIAIHLSFVSVAAATVLRSKRYGQVSMITALLLGFAALQSYSVLNQLLGQTCGLSLALALLTLLTRPVPSSLSEKTKLAAAAAVVLAANLICYPETLPYTVAACFLYYVRLFLSDRKGFPRYILFLALVLLVLLILNGQYIYTSLVHLRSQIAVSAVTEGEKRLLFPYFLVPSGIGSLWGFLPLVWVKASEPWLSLGIILGIVLSVFWLSMVFRLAWQGDSLAYMAVILLLSAVWFYFGKADFALFKTALFAQPLLFSLLVLGLHEIAGRNSRRRNFFLWSILVLVGGVNAYNTWNDHLAVASDRRMGGNQMWNGSKNQVKSEYGKLIAAIDEKRNIIVDTPSFIVSGWESLQTIGRRTSYTVDVMRDYVPQKGEDYFMKRFTIANPGLVRSFQEARSIINEKREHATSTFPMADKSQLKFVDPLQDSVATGEPAPAFLYASELQTIFNRRSWQGKVAHNYRVGDMSRISNHLVFVASARTVYPEFSHVSASYYQLEKDPFSPESSMSALGEDLFFRVVNPTNPVWLVMDITASLKADGKNELPPFTVTTTENMDPGITGRGAARIFLPIERFQWINGSPYLFVHMGKGQTFPSKRYGLMRLYGENVELDQRRLTCFARGIALISDGEYHALIPPRFLSRFPDDLLNMSVEYAGFYEDGWIGEDSRAVLSTEGRLPLLNIRGMIPLINDADFKTDLAVLVNKKVLKRFRLGLGEFNVDIPYAHGGERNLVELHFTAAQRLPGGDNRIVAAKINFIGFH